MQQSRDDLHKEMEKIQKELTQAKNEQQKSATELIKVIIEGAMNKSDDDDDVPFEVEIENFNLFRILTKATNILTLSVTFKVA